jgi:hypothetical protein
MFENRMLRRIFGPKMDEIIGGWRKLHNEEIQNIYTSPNKNDEVKEDEMYRACSTHGREQEYIQSSGGTLDGNSLLRKPSNRWKDNI